MFCILVCCSAIWCCCCLSNIASYAGVMVGSNANCEFRVYDNCALVVRIGTRIECASCYDPIGISACNRCCAFGYGNRLACSVDIVSQASRCWCRSACPCECRTACSTAVGKYYRGKCLFEAESLVLIT